MRERSVVDLFCGAGGWAAGMQLLGVDEQDTLGIDTNRDAVATHEGAGWPALCEDIQSIEPKQRLDGLIASPPCQSFSSAGKGKGRNQLDALLAHVIAVGEEGHWWEPTADVTGDDPRSRLSLEPLRWIAATRPRWVAMEQVPTVQPLWNAYADALSAWGYSVDTDRLQAEEYGVPQTRRRSILVARNDAEVSLPEGTHTRYYAQREGKGRYDLPGLPESKGGGRAEEEGLKPWVSMAEALGWGMPDRPFYTYAGVSDTSHAIGDREFGGASVRKDLAERAASGDPSRWVYDRPATTIVGSERPDIVAGPGYRKAGDGPRQDAPGSVRVTVEQAATLQSFPADWPWIGSRSSKYRQVGNAVPPLLAAAVLGQVIP